LRGVASVNGALQHGGPEREPVDGPFTPTSGTHSYAMAGSTADGASRRRHRQKKATNVVQEQLMRINRINRGAEKLNTDLQAADDGEPPVAASSVTVAVRADGAAGSVQTNYTQSDMGPLGLGSAVQAHGQAAARQSGHSG